MGSGRAPLRLSVVEDAELVVQGLARMTEPFADRVRFVGATHLEEVAEEPAPAAADVALVDTAPVENTRRWPPDVDLETLRRQARARRVAVWSWDLDGRLVDRALEQGASGYLGKMLPAAELVTALERIHEGERVVSPAPLDLAAEPHDWPGRDFGLTARESEIIGMITLGLANQQIADRAFLSINSVKSYIRSSYRKMGVTSRSRAVLWGIEHGFRR